MWKRKYERLVRDKLRRYPAVALVGPRQCGKTTLARRLGGHYYDMEAEGGYLRLDAEWAERMAGTDLVVIDEAQVRPEVFRRLRGVIDEDRGRKGRFLLLGSVSPSLARDVGESLAGRLGFVEMGPFALAELKAAQMDALWLFGGYPDGGIRAPEMFPEWQRDYLQALVRRDLPAWGLPAKPAQTERLLGMLAALQGQNLNASQLGTALGLDSKTVRSYIDFLEGAYLVRFLPPYFSNLKKRLVKTPRMYVRDSGLLHGLLRVRDREELFAQPWVGHSWEGFLIEQTLAALALARDEAEAFFFRTSDGYEIDLVLQWGVRRWAVEMKLTSDPSVDDVRRLRKTAAMMGAERSALLCRVPQSVRYDDVWVVHPAEWVAALLRGRS